MHHHVNHSTHPSLRDYCWVLGGEALVVPLSSELGTTAYVCVCRGGDDCRAGVITDLFPGSLFQPHVTSMSGESWHGQDSLWGTWVA